MFDASPKNGRLQGEESRVLRVKNKKQCKEKSYFINTLEDLDKRDEKYDNSVTMSRNRYQRRPIVLPWVSLAVVDFE